MIHAAVFFATKCIIITFCVARHRCGQCRGQDTRCNFASRWQCNGTKKQNCIASARKNCSVYPQLY